MAAPAQESSRRGQQEYRPLAQVRHQGNPLFMDQAPAAAEAAVRHQTGVMSMMVVTMMMGRRRTRGTRRSRRKTQGLPQLRSSPAPWPRRRWSKPLRGQGGQVHWCQPRWVRPVHLTQMIWCWASSSSSGCGRPCTGACTPTRCEPSHAGTHWCG